MSSSESASLWGTPVHPQVTPSQPTFPPRSAHLPPRPTFATSSAPPPLRRGAAAASTPLIPESQQLITPTASQGSSSEKEGAIRAEASTSRSQGYGQDNFRTQSAYPATDKPQLCTTVKTEPLDSFATGRAATEAVRSDVCRAGGIPIVRSTKTKWTVTCSFNGEGCPWQAEARRLLRGKDKDGQPLPERWWVDIVNSEHHHESQIRGPPVAASSSSSLPQPVMAFKYDGGKGQDHNNRAPLPPVKSSRYYDCDAAAAKPEPLSPSRAANRAGSPPRSIHRNVIPPFYSSPPARGRESLGKGPSGQAIAKVSALPQAATQPCSSLLQPPTRPTAQKDTVAPRVAGPSLSEDFLLALAGPDVPEEEFMRSVQALFECRKAVKKSSAQGLEARGGRSPPWTPVSPPHWTPLSPHWSPRSPSPPRHNNEATTFRHASSSRPDEQARPTLSHRSPSRHLSSSRHCHGSRSSENDDRDKEPRASGRHHHHRRSRSPHERRRRRSNHYEDDPESVRDRSPHRFRRERRSPERTRRYQERERERERHDDRHHSFEDRRRDESHDRRLRFREEHHHDSRSRHYRNADEGRRGRSVTTPNRLRLDRRARSPSLASRRDHHEQH